MGHYKLDGTNRRAPANMLPKQLDQIKSRKVHICLGIFTQGYFMPFYCLDSQCKSPRIWDCNLINQPEMHLYLDLTIC